MDESKEPKPKEDVRTFTAEMAREERRRVKM
jgi:hypothetical protein